MEVKIKKDTIVRTIMFLIVIVNIVLEKSGLDLIPTDENTISALVEMVIEIAVIIVGFWKNNSFSKKAIKADNFLKLLREGVYKNG